MTADTTDQNTDLCIASSPLEIPEPVSSALVECVLHYRSNDSDVPDEVDRALYFFQRLESHKNIYRSHMRLGLLCMTDRSAGPRGEPIIDRMEWGLEYGGTFRDWSEVQRFLANMRATEIQYILA